MYFIPDLLEVITVSKATITPIVETVRPVCACVTRRMIATMKIAVLLIKRCLSIIASAG